MVKTLYQSRQLINHKKVLVNKLVQSKVDYRVNKGDLIELKLFDCFFDKNLMLLSKNNKKLKIFNKINYKISELLYKINEFKIICNYSNFKDFNCNKIEKLYYFFNFFPNHIEVNYKTLSIVFLDDISINKSFQFYVNLVSLLNYYNTK
jgi:ribosomal protein S4